jgi:hypothetical protein
MYCVVNSQPLNAEIYSSTPFPINGTLQTIVCEQQFWLPNRDPTGVQQIPVIQPATPRTTEVCNIVVDQPRRLKVDAYHVSMGIPFAVSCCIGALFCIITSKVIFYSFGEIYWFVLHHHKLGNFLLFGEI